MSREFLSQVRDQLESRSTRTSLSELRERGMKQVRVIRSSQILQLIEEAVDRAIDERGLTATSTERDEMIASSTEIFQDLSREQAPSAQTQRLEQTEAQIRELQELLQERDQELQASLARQAELDAELRVLHQRGSAGAPDSLLSELRALRSDLDDVKNTKATVDNEALEGKLADLGRELGDELSRIGRRVGIRSAEEKESDLSAIFNQDMELESNLENVEASESKGNDVADALARMKSLKKKKST